jgi:hypothetical protein
MPLTGAQGRFLHMDLTEVLRTGARVGLAGNSGHGYHLVGDQLRAFNQGLTIGRRMRREALDRIKDLGPEALGPEEVGD